MKTAIWIVFALLAVLWTGGALLVSELAQWAAQTLAAGDHVDLAQGVAEIALPAWLAQWLDPAAVESLQLALISALDALQAELPTVGVALSWLVPVIWAFWGLGLLVLLALAGGAHLLASRAKRPPSATGA